MDESRFDSLARQVGEAMRLPNTRRSALGAAVAATVALAGLTTLSGTIDAKKKRKRRKKCEKCKPRPAGSLCTTNEQCCTDKTNRICALAPGSGSSTLCCGGTGAACTSDGTCCRHFSCVLGFCRM